MVLKKSQRVLSFALSLIVLLALSSVFCFERAGAVSDGEWTYEIEAGGANITGYSGTDKVVTVPAKIGDQKVYKVSSLSNNYFKDKITSVTFSNGISVLGDSVCKGYSALERVSFPETLTSIGNDAFFGCPSLLAVTIPNSVSSFGTGAFAGCTALSSATLNCRATSIPSKLFAGDKNLNTLTIPTYTSEIGSDAFEGCSSLVNLNLPSCVKTIGSSAFAGCSRLTNIVLPADLKTIGQDAFMNCTSLTKLFIPNKTRTIEDEAFSGCSSLRTVYICPSVSIVKSRIFNGCSNLEKVVFGGEYTNLGSLSFSTFTATIYYPAKYASSWANYSSTNMKSYQSATNINVSGDTTVKAGSTVNLNVSLNGDMKDAYIITSSNPNVVSVSADGTILARTTGVSTLTITAVSGVSKSIEVSVQPAAPTSVKASAKTTTSADITWKEVYNVTGYNIYRSTSKNGSFKKVGSSTTTSFTDKGLTKGKTYYYKVVSYVSSDGKQIASPYSSVVSVKACAPAPASITAKKAKSGVAKITWGKSVGASGYEVYMATSANGKFTKISTVSKPTTLSCTKTGLKSGKTYYFKVRTYTTVGGTKVYSDYTKTVKVKV